jgi:A/G-specific adenine glycosylase
MSRRPRTDALPWSEARIRRLRAALLAYFDRVRRQLPWRETSDPYRILVSEVMLQQTRVETVVPYYRRWMERFPDAETLAGAEADEVLGLWEGLGYYSRARNLHRAVREVAARYGGELPSEPAGLRELPGVGAYTAGAVASIAFGRPVPAVDGNVRRVLARLLDEPAPSPPALERWAGALVDPDRPGDFNQSLMELGALVCTPRSPGCDACPVEEWCRARAAGTQEERPARRPKKKAPLVHDAVAVLMRTGGAGEEVLLRKRPEEGLLAGLWELPGIRVGSPEEAGAGSLVLARELLGVSGEPEWAPEGLPTVAHAFSHLRMRYHPFVFRDVGNGKDGAEPPPLRWASVEELDEPALPVAQRRILEGALGRPATRHP